MKCRAKVWDRRNRKGSRKYLTRQVTAMGAVSGELGIGAKEYDHQ